MTSRTLSESSFIDGLQYFLNASVTPYHAVLNISDTLKTFGYEELNFSSTWDLKADKGYFITKNNSSIIAFTTGDQFPEDGYRIIGAHTDSPCLKLRTTAQKKNEGYLQAQIETYGGVLQSTWFDRDLALAGIVHYINSDDQIKTTYLDSIEAIAYIPSLAIHLDREANSKKSINAERHLHPIVGLETAAKSTYIDLERWIRECLHKQQITCFDKILSYDLNFYDTQQSKVIGMNKEFIASARIDNLLSCYTALMSLVTASPLDRNMFVFTDHEEVGSQSACGAQSPFLSSVLQRISSGNLEQYQACISNSWLASVDNAHAVHPNYTDKHIDLDKPIINNGPVLKHNANQRYATNSEGTSFVKYIAQKNKIPLQHFHNRNDLGCGSTIGPITASETGIRSFDIGAPQLGMHSIRELCGTKDAWYLMQLLQGFLKEEHS